MKGNVAVVDSCAIIFLLAREDAVHKNTRRHLEQLLGDGFRFVVPAVVVAELRHGGLDGSKHVEKFAAAAKGALRVVSLTQQAADVAGLLREKALAKRRETNPEAVRGTIPYDALILGTAITEKASVILTGDRDYRALLDVADARLDVRNAREPPKGQAPLLDVGPGAPKSSKVPKKRRSA